MIGVAAQKKRQRIPKHKRPRPIIAGEVIVHRDEPVIRPKRAGVAVEVIHGEPMPAAYLPVDPLVFSIKQRLESLEADMGLVHETIAAIGDAARVSLLEDADDPGQHQKQESGGDVSRSIGQEVRRLDVRDVTIKGRRP